MDEKAASAIRLNLGDAPTERALALSQAVNDGRVGTEPHVLFESIDEYARDMGPLFRLARFFLDDRGKRHHFPWRFNRQIRRARLPYFVNRLRLNLRHARQN